MADRPTDLPTWATGTSNVDEPTLAERAAGWSTLQRVPARLLNGILRSLGQWAEYLDEHSLRTFPSLDAMWADGSVGAGELVTVPEPTTSPGATTLTTLGADPAGVATDGRRVYVASASTSRAVERLTGTTIWTTGLSLGSDVPRMATDGQTLLRYKSLQLRGDSCATGALRWGAAYAIGTPPLGMAVRGSRLVVGTVRFTGADGPFSTRVLNADTGALVWGVNDHTTWACTLSGTDVYVAASNDGSDLVLRRYAIGSSTAVQTVTLDSSTSAPTLQMVTDGELVYACRAQTTGALLCVNGRDLASTVWSANITGGVDLIALDDRFLYAHVVGATTVRAYDRFTGRLAREVEVGGDITGLAADGQYLYVARAGTADLVARVVVARRRPRVWQVADVSDSHRPFPWAIIPGGA